MTYGLIRNENYGKVLSYSLVETVYETQELWDEFGHEYTEKVVTFKKDEFENELKKNDYDYLKTCQELASYLNIKNIFRGF